MTHSTERMTVSEEETIDTIVEKLTSKAMEGCKRCPETQISIPEENEVVVAIQKTYGNIYQNVIEENEYM